LSAHTARKSTVCTTFIEIFSRKKKSTAFALQTFYSKITLADKGLNLHSLMSVAVAEGSSCKKILALEKIHAECDTGTSSVLTEILDSSALVCNGLRLSNACL